MDPKERQEVIRKIAERLAVMPDDTPPNSNNQQPFRLPPTNQQHQQRLHNLLQQSQQYHLPTHQSQQQYFQPMPSAQQNQVRPLSFSMNQTQSSNYPTAAAHENYRAMHEETTNGVSTRGQQQHSTVQQHRQNEYFDQNGGPHQNQFSLSSAPQQHSRPSNFQLSVPARQRYSSYNSVNNQYFDQYYDDTDSVFEYERTSSAPVKTRNAPTRNATTRPTSRRQSPATRSSQSSSAYGLRRHTTSVTHFPNTANTHPRKTTSLMAHTHDQKPHSLVSTGRSSKILSTTPTAGSGAQTFVCSTKAFVQHIMINSSTLSATMEDGQMVGPINVQPGFFNAFQPAPALTISSTDAKTFKEFYESCSDFLQWSQHIRSIALEGVLHSDTVLQMSSTMPGLHHFQMIPTKFSEPIDLSAWLLRLPQITTLIVDGRLFDGSFFYDDTRKICQWMKQNGVQERSVTLYTNNMCGPEPLRSLLDNDMQEISNMNVLTIISATPLYEPIHQVLRSAMHYGPTLQHPLLNDVYVSFTCDYNENFVFNIGFSRSTKSV